MRSTIQSKLSLQKKQGRGEFFLNYLERYPNSATPHINKHTGILGALLIDLVEGERGGEIMIYICKGDGAFPK